MELWMIIAGVVLLLGLLYLGQAAPVEGFLNIDPQEQLAQRQMGQMEGERRYNDLARLQNPFNTPPDDQVAAAVAQVVPAPSSTQGGASLLGLLGFGQFGGLDDGSNKMGASTEQTGMVANKINFCEGITNVDCGLLDDPRLAECGFCHKDGKNSKGKPHRGGMFISSDDQIRANEKAGKGYASYKPTIGTCDPANFTLVEKKCSNLEKNLECQRAGAATENNECGQCFGAAKPGTTGLLYMGPKPTTYNATLHISHAGSHQTAGGDGIAIIVNGERQSFPPSSNPVLEYTPIPLLDLKEGDNISISLYGAPPVWTAWLSNESGSRTLSLNLAETGQSPQGAYVIAGQTNSKVVEKYMKMFADPNEWARFKNTVPSNVLWYERREIIQPATVQAWYGNSPDLSQALAGVTSNVKLAATLGKDFMANAGDTGAKFLYIKQDTGRTIVFPSGRMVPIKKVQNIVAMDFKVPATLTDPPVTLYNDDRFNCTAGPIITTAAGAGVLGANTCFTADGKFNPILSCIRRLFIGAGGTAQGTLYPKSEEDAKKIAKPTLDATLEYLNGLYNAAAYGSDENDAPVDFEVIQASSMAMFGYSLKNPCEGPNQGEGPHSIACLDYLWRTSGNPGADNQPVDLKKLPYNYCTANGVGAPIRSDGTINYQTVDWANNQDSISKIRDGFRGVYELMQNSDFELQRYAMRQCLNVSVMPPPPSATDCPVKNPDEWQCYGPSKLAGDDVFYVAPGGYSVERKDAQSVCASYGARVATLDELTRSQRAGADWCATGHVADSDKAYYPRNSNLPPGQWGCGGPGINEYTPGKAGVNCIGKRPRQGDPAVFAFNSRTWSNPYFTIDKIQISLTPAVAAGQHFARHENFELFTHPNDGGEQIKQDGTFEIVDPTNGAAGYVSFRSVNYTDRYLRHTGYVMYLHPSDGSTAFNNDSSFKIVPALNGNPDMISIHASNLLTLGNKSGDNFYVALDRDGSPARLVLADKAAINVQRASWYRTPSLLLNSPISETAVPMCKNENGTIVCVTSNPNGGTEINYSAKEKDCTDWLEDPEKAKIPLRSTPAPQGLAYLVSTYLKNRS